MDILLIVLRVLHIVLGLVWVGFGVVGAWVIEPLADKMGEKGNSLVRVFYAYSNFNKVFPVVAIGTTLAGIILWVLRADGPYLQGFSQTGSFVMGFGAVVGLLAFGHGAAATGRFAGQFGKAAREYEEAENPTDEQRQTVQELRAKNKLHGNISAWLTVIAVIAMSGARYL